MLKLVCVKCKKEIMANVKGNYKMILQMGPRGFRTYATCTLCAAKMEKANGTSGKKRTFA
jgi:hypothetical protein